jgi:hypothetical protein
MASQDAGVLNVLYEYGVLGVRGYSQCEKFLKQIHTLARRCRWVPEGAANYGLAPSDFMYVNILLGRYYLDEAANDDTVKDRTEYYGEHLAFDSKQSAMTSDEHRRSMERFEDTAAQIAGKVWQSSRVKTLTDWRARFVQYASSGSAGGKSGDEFNVEHGVNKRLWLSARSEHEIAAYVLGQHAFASTTTVVKREAGKLRQLLPASVPHWMVEVNAVSEIEAAIMRELPLSVEMEADEEAMGVLSRRANMLRGFTACCIDWADFNITHTLHDMAEYYRCLGRTALRHCPSIGEYYDGLTKGEFLKKAFDWMADTLYNSWIRNGAEKHSEYERITRGLWSGWRTTQFVNCSFNIAYSESVFDSMHRLWKSSAPLSRHHFGDDYFGSVAEEFDGLGAMAMMSWCQHELNPTKQLVGGAMGEFLRHEYFPDGRIQGSCNRAYGSYVGSDLQAPDIYSSLEQVQGTNEAINMIIRRGANRAKCEVYRYVHVAFWGTIKDGISSATPSIKLMQLDPACGGLGCPRFGAISTYTNGDLGRAPSMRSYKGAVEPSGVPFLMKRFHQKLHEFGFYTGADEVLRETLMDAVYGADYPSDLKREADTKLRREQMLWVLAANACVGQLKPIVLPDTPRHIEELIKADMAAALSKDNHAKKFEAYNLNQMADTIRAIALGELAVLDSSLGRISAEAGRVAGYDAVVAMGRGQADSLIRVLHDHLPHDMVRRLVEHKVHIPTSTGGVVSPQLRALQFRLLNASLLYLRGTNPTLWHDQDYVLRYVRSVNMRIAHEYSRLVGETIKM